MANAEEIKIKHSIKSENLDDTISSENIRINLSRNKKLRTILIK